MKAPYMEREYNPTEIMLSIAPHPSLPAGRLPLSPQGRGREG